MSRCGWLKKALLLVCMALHQTTFKSRAAPLVPCQLPDEDVNFFDVRLPVQVVPSKLTTYVCHHQNVPRVALDRFLHVIGFQPLISNPNVVHHMILFGCSDSLQSQETPHECSEADGECRNFVVQWSRGIAGPICSPPQAGVALGPGSVRSFLLQIHWNNENASSAVSEDESGFRVFYTAKRRPHDLGNVQIGQNDLEIPPTTALTLQSGSCSSECTREWLDKPIYLTRAHIHMHYLGSGGSMRLFRAGEEAVTLFEDKTYNYSQPPAHYFVKPIKVMPGDEIKVTCNFNSLDGFRKRTQTVNWGEGSDAEMCYAFVTYYPKVPNFDQCIQFADQDVCPRNSNAVIGECVFPGFVHIFESGLAGEIIKHCTEASTGPSSLQSEELSCKGANRKKLCSGQCLKAVREVTDHPCMQGRLRHTAMRRYLPKTFLWPKVEAVISLLASGCCIEKA